MHAGTNTKRRADFCILRMLLRGVLLGNFRDMRMRITSRIIAVTRKYSQEQAVETEKNNR